MRNFVNRYGVLPSNRAIVVTNNDDAYRTALSLDEAGANVVVVDLRIGATGPLITAARDAGIMIMAGHAVTLAHGGQRVARVEICPLMRGPPRSSVMPFIWIVT